MCFSIYAAAVAIAVPELLPTWGNALVRLFAFAGGTYAISLMYEFISKATADLDQHTALMEFETKSAEAKMFNSAMRAYEDIE